MIRIWWCALGLFVMAVAGSSVLAQTLAPENTGQNLGIVRTVTGKLTYRTISDQRHRGGEEFRLLVYPDGTRQLFVSKDFKAFNAQHTIVARVDARFRPLETYASYRTGNGFGGSIYVTVAGSELRTVAFGPQGRIDDKRTVSDNIVVVHHGEVANGWYVWMDDGSAAVQRSNALILNAAPPSGGQVSAVYAETRFTRLGPEQVTTPAGAFETTHYRLAGPEPLDLWIATEDRLVVRQVDLRHDREYVLTEMNVIRN